MQRSQIFDQLSQQFLQRFSLFGSRLHQTEPWFTKHSRKLQRILILAIGLPLLVLGSGCNTPVSQLNSTFLAPPLELTILQVEPSGQPGTYTVSGNATLPDNTPITVSAVRYLEAATRLSSSAEANPAYVILDRQFAQVNQDNWRTELTLWQVAPDGSFREAWQLDQPNTSASYQPESTVTFLATLDPTHRPSDLQERVERLDDTRQATLMRFTTDGELYIQSSKSLPIALPTGATTPPGAGTPPITRAALPPVDVTPTPTTSLEDWEQTSAPLSPDAVLR
jgi:hypothetical protein